MRRLQIILVLGMAFAMLQWSTTVAFAAPSISITSSSASDVNAHVQFTISGTPHATTWAIAFGTDATALGPWSPPRSQSRYLDWEYARLGDLAPSTTYYYRLSATDRDGSTTTSVQTVMTSEPREPSAHVTNPEDYGPSSAELVVRVTSGTAATVQLRWRRESGGAVVTATERAITGPVDDIPVPFTAGELDPDTTYLAWATVRNAQGEVTTEESWFRSARLAPRVDSSTMRVLLRSFLGVDVAFEGGAWPENGWALEYGTTSSYGSLSTFDDDDSRIIVVEPRLASGTWYHARVVAHGRGSTSYGPDMSLLSLARADSVVAAARTSTSTRIAGEVHSREPVRWKVVVSSPSGVTSETPTFDRVTGGTVNTVLEGLEPETTYSATIRVTNATGTDSSDAITFSTPAVALPAPAAPPNPVTPPSSDPRPPATLTPRRAITGSHRADRYIGTAGADVFHGLRGNDTFSGHAGNDQFHGGAGNDVANGGAGNDRLWGDAGSDRLVGGAGADRLFGGTGNDILIATDRRGGDIVDCGVGKADRAIVDRGDAVRNCERVTRR